MSARPHEPALPEGAPAAAPAAVEARLGLAAPTLSVVVPAKNEEDSLPLLLDRLEGVATAHSLALTEVILIDDGSTDRTWPVMERLAQERPLVRAFRLRRNFGKATALMVGIEASRGDVIITMDADLQDDPDELPRFLEELGKGYDLVSGWKKVRHDPLSKTLPSRLFNWVTARVSGLPLHDFNCGFKAYRREVFSDIQLYGELHRYVPVLAHALGFRVGEIAVRHHPRRYGQSKYGVARFLRGLLDLLSVLMITRYAYRPGHLFGGIGVALGLLGTLVLAYLSALKLFTGAQIGNRPLLLFGVMTLIIGIQVLLFGLLAELVLNRTGRQTPTRNLIAARTDPEGAPRPAPPR